MMKRTLILALASVSGWSVPAFSQDNGITGASSNHERRKDVVVKETIERLPAVESAASDPQDGVATSSISVLGSSNDTSVAVTISSEPNIIPDWGYGYGSLVLRAPLNEDATTTSFLTTQGLTNKVSVTGSYTFLFINTRVEPATIADIRTLTDQLDLKCENDLRKRASPEELALLDGPNDNTARYALLDKECFKSTVLEQRPEGYKKKFVTAADQNKIDGIAGDLIGERSLTILNVSGSIGYKKFTYLDGISFAENARKTTPFSLSATIGYHDHRTAPLIAIGYEYKRDYKAADKRVLCPVGTGTTPVECKFEIFDKPKDDNSHTLFGLARFRNLFAIGSKDRSTATKPAKSGAVLEIKGAYNFHDKIFGISVPLYFLLDKEGEVKAGVRMDWEEKGSNPDKDQLRFGVFVTKSFGFLDI
jgi:hypothetical protein